MKCSSMIYEVYEKRTDTIVTWVAIHKDGTSWRRDGFLRKKPRSTPNWHRWFRLQMKPDLNEYTKIPRMVMPRE